MKLLHRSPDTLASVRNWPAYLKTMATSICYDHLRKKIPENWSSLPSMDQDDRIPSTDSDPEYLFSIEQKYDSLRKAIAHLSKQDAEVFCLRYMEDLSYQEIADQLSISNNLVGVTLHRVNKKLTQLLTEADAVEQPNFKPGESYESV